MLGGPGSSHETPGFPGKVLGDKGGVLGENIRVGGILKCHSLTSRFVLLRQERRDRRKWDTSSEQIFISSIHSLWKCLTN